MVLAVRHEIDLDRFQLRLVARVRNGEHRPAQIFRIDRGPASAAQMWALVHNLKPSEVVAYELYRATVRWVEIPNIATKPDMPPVETPQPAVTFGPVIERQLRLAPDAAADRGLDLKDNMGGQVRENPVHLTPHEQ
jgi:hypothetical protein